MVGGIGATTLKRRARLLLREALRLGLNVQLDQIIRNYAYWERAIFEARKAAERRENKHES